MLEDRAFLPRRAPRRTLALDNVRSCDDDLAGRVAVELTRRSPCDNARCNPNRFDAIFHPSLMKPPGSVH